MCAYRDIVWYAKTVVFNSRPYGKIEHRAAAGQVTVSPFDSWQWRMLPLETVSGPHTNKY